MSERVLHCWEDQCSTLEFGSEAWAEAYAAGGGTCMLEHGHDGPHEWTPDDQIGVTFAPADCAPVAEVKP